jgi:hypothetical protein
MNAEYKRCEMLSARLLFTNGFLPSRKGVWTKRTPKALTTARMGNKCPILRIEGNELSYEGIMLRVGIKYVNIPVVGEAGLAGAIDAINGIIGSNR